MDISLIYIILYDNRTTFKNIYFKLENLIQDWIKNRNKKMKMRMDKLKKDYIEIK